MARTEDLRKYLTDVGNAIKKTRSNYAKIPAKNFDEEIEKFRDWETDKTTVAKDYILEGKEIIADRPDFSKPDTSVSENKLYMDYDNFGQTYYYRGDVKDNYFKFANYYWRIIRINGDNSIRIIYDGTQPWENGVASEDRVLKDIAYTENGNYYELGLRYTRDRKHGFESPTKILGADENPAENTLNWWYEQNIKNTKYEIYLEPDAGFICDRTNDNKEFSDYNEIDDINGAVARETSWYGAYFRLEEEKNPIFQFRNLNDYFTMRGSHFGNCSLIYPIGLITADEACFAGIGMRRLNNFKYYLYTGKSYWTETPCTKNQTYMYVLRDGAVYGESHTNNTNVHAVKPVLNVSGRFPLKGTGTIDDPYEIEDTTDMVAGIIRIWKHEDKS